MKDKEKTLKAAKKKKADRLQSNNKLTNSRLLNGNNKFQNVGIMPRVRQEIAINLKLYARKRSFKENDELKIFSDKHKATSLL